MTVYDAIDRELKARRISRRELAIRVGIPPTTFQSAFCRNSPISFEHFVLIAYALGVSIEDLLRGTDLGARLTALAQRTGKA